MWIPFGALKSSTNCLDFGDCPNVNVAPPSWRLFAGWKPALHPKLGQHPILGTSSSMIDAQCLDRDFRLTCLKKAGWSGRKSAAHSATALTPRARAWSQDAIRSTPSTKDDPRRKSCKPRTLSLEDHRPTPSPDEEAAWSFYISAVPFPAPGPSNDSANQRYDLPTYRQVAVPGACLRESRSTTTSSIKS